MTGLLGSTLFYADSILTPAVSVLSALEGVAIATPALTGHTMPIGVAILILLFSVQHHGTSFVGRIFGPLILLWFLMLAITGIQQIVLEPRILDSLNPANAVAFLNNQTAQGQLLPTIGNIVLGVTGSECLYADLGHFGPLPIRLSWALVTLPALALNYMGQGALLLRDPSLVNPRPSFFADLAAYLSPTACSSDRASLTRAAQVSNPFYYLFPTQFLYPAVALSTIATVIASQAVISGTYSMSCEAMRLGFLPRMEVRHTSKSKGGQIYVPTVNLLRMPPPGAARSQTCRTWITCVSFQRLTFLLFANARAACHCRL